MSWTITPSFTQWTPALISTALWLDAADASTLFTTNSGSILATNGSAVGRWNDKSGNGRNATQPTAGRRPVYSASFLNSKAVVSFDGSDDILGFTDRSLGQNVTGLSYFFVAIPSAPSSTDYRALVDLNTNLGPDRASVYFRSNTIEAGGRRLDTDSYQFQQSGSTTIAACIGSVAFDYSFASLAVGFNGSSLSYRSGGFQTTGSTSNTQSTFISIGASNDSGVDAFTAAVSGAACDCRIAEIVVIHTTLSDITRQKLEGYLAHKWDLTANLPANHPYKVNPPAP